MRSNRQRLDRENAESQAAWYWCRQHPERARDASMHCEECIAAGYELRVQAVRVGGRILHTITLPPERAS